MDLTGKITKDLHIIDGTDPMIVSGLFLTIFPPLEQDFLSVFYSHATTSQEFGRQIAADGQWLENRVGFI